MTIMKTIMLNKFIIAGIISFSISAVIPQVVSAGRSVSKQVTVSGPGGMCRTVTITVDSLRANKAQRRARRYWGNAAKKVVLDYRLTHSLSSHSGPATTTRRMARGYRATAVGRVCFANR